MKKILLLSSFFLSTTVFAGELNSYNDIVTYITYGVPLHFVTNFAQCTGDKVNAAKTMSLGSFTPSEIGVTENHVAAATTHFTLNDPFFPGKAVYEYARYTITPDNNMTVSLQVLDAATYTKLMNPISFNCKLKVATTVYYYANF